MMPRHRRFYFIASIVLFAIEVLIALFVHDQFVRPYVGDYLVVILLYCCVRSFFSWPVTHVAIACLLFSYLIEMLQYFQLVELLHLQQYRWARVIIGTYFTWTDMVAYTLGIGTVLLAERLLGSRLHPQGT